MDPSVASKDELGRLWREHLTTPFPRKVTRHADPATDLVLLDGYVAGLVSRYFDLDGESPAEVVWEPRLDRTLLAVADKLSNLLQQPIGQVEREYATRLAAMAKILKQLRGLRSQVDLP